MAINYRMTATRNGETIFTHDICSEQAERFPDDMLEAIARLRSLVPDFDILDNKVNISVRQIRPADGADGR